MTRPVRFAAVGLDHAHVFGQVSGLLGQGAEFVGMAGTGADSPVFAEARRRWPSVPVAAAERWIGDDTVDLVLTAGVPADRAAVAVAALRAGRHVVADKPGCTSAEQLEQIRAAVADSGRFWSVTFSERFEVRAVARAGQLVRDGAIGTVVQTLGLGPHRIGSHLAGGAGRPDWFWEPARYGGILADIASHQIDQFLWFTGAARGAVVASTVGNFGHPEHPAFQDFGEVMLRSDSAQGYVRNDWFTPDGLATWGDGRLFVLGTQGYLEMRKYIDIAGRPGGEHLFVVDGSGTRHEDCSQVPLTYYPDIVRDVAENTRTACPQEHTFETTRLALLAQAQATVRRIPA